MSDDLVAFLQARLDEDEAAAKAAQQSARGIVGELAQQAGPCVDEAGYVHIARHDPARVLREVAAKRKLLECVPEADGLDLSNWMEFAAVERDTDAEPFLGDVLLRAIAVVYSDHPDYDQAWA